MARAKRLMLIVGQRKALVMAVQGRRERRWWSKLREWLADAVQVAG